MTRLFLEFGNHETVHKYADEMYDRMLAGNMHSTEWNESVTERIRKYSPGMITVDSAIPAMYDGGGEDYEVNQKVWYYHLMPDTPRMLTGRDEIILLAADFHPLHYEPNSLRSELASLVNCATFVGSSTVAGLGVGRGIDAVKNLLHVDEDKGDVNVLMSRMKRRQFMGLVLAAGSTALYYSDRLLPFSSYRKTQEYGQLLARVTNPVHAIENSIDGGMTKLTDGRTALLIAKSQYVGEKELAKTHWQPVSVVMGSAHVNRSYDFLRSEKQRIHAIKDLALYIAETMPQPAKDAKYTKEERIKSCFAWLRICELIKITEPDPIKFKADPLAEIGRTVTHIRSYIAPEVDEALALLPKQYSQLTNFK